MHLSGLRTLSIHASTSLLISILHISSCQAYVDWLYPPKSSSRALAYNYNDVVYFTWDSNFTSPSLTLWCESDDVYNSVYTDANVTTNGFSPQSFPYPNSFNQSCHMSMYCHGSPDCGPVGQSAEFSLLHDVAAAAQTWGLSATSSIGKAVAATATATTSTSSLAAATTATGSASPSATGTGIGTAAPQASSGGLSAGAKAGIGVGVAVGVMIFIGALWFCATQARKRRRDWERAPTKVVSEMGPGWVGPPRQEMDGEGRTGELGGTPQVELSAVASPVASPVGHD